MDKNSYSVNYIRDLNHLYLYRPKRYCCIHGFSW